MLDYPRGFQLDPKLTQQNQMLLQKYQDKIPGYPTILVLDSESEVKGILGYEPGGPKPWVQKADIVVSRAM